MATSAPPCGICEHRKKNTPALVWCHECDEGLCESCQDYHGSVKASREHKTIPISEYLKLPSSLKEIIESCDIHSEKFITYCKDHNTPCCRKCLVETHSKCTYVVLEDVIGNAKTSSCFQEIEETITELVSNVKKIRKNRVANKARIAKQKEEIATNIRELRQNINKHLDKLEKSLLSQLSMIEKNEISKLDSGIELISDKERKLLEKQSTIENVKTHASNLQAFLYTKQEESDIAKIQAHLSSTANEDVMCEADLCFTMDTGVENILSGITALGNVNVQTNPLKLSLKIGKEKQAQMIPIVKKRNFESVGLKIKRIYESSVRSVYGLTTIPENGILFTQFYEKCISRLSSNNSSSNFNIATKLYPFDVALVDDTTLAVSSGGNYPTSISLLDSRIKSEIKAFTLPSFVYGIAIKSNHIFCAVYYGQSAGIYRLNISNGKVNKIKTIAINMDAYLAVQNDRLLFTAPYEHCVTCCNLNGSLIWTFKDETILRRPSGVTVDDDDLVYVVGNESNNVVVLTADGKSCRQLLSKDDGLDSPTAIHFDRTRNEMLVANKTEKIFKFSVV